MNAFNRIVFALEESACEVEALDGNAEDVMVQCPAHNDDTASLHVTGIEGQALMYCHAGCSTAEILDEIGLSLSDLYDSPRGATYDYDDGRRVHRKPDKSFRQSGNTKGTASLYRLGKVKDAVELGLPVFLVEGEKDVHSLEKHGCVATTAPMGSNNFRKVDVSPLSGAVVVAVRDNDEAGRKWAGQVRDALSGVAESVVFKVAASGKDTTDHLMAGLGVEELVTDDDGDAAMGAAVNVTDDTEALGWLKAELGRHQLSGFLRRGDDLVHTPRVGEDGYVPPKEDDDTGPAQVRRVSPLQLAGRIDHCYTVVRGRKDPRPALFPQTIANRAAANLDLLPNVRELAGVTHTPMVRADGSILDAPGYDEATGMLYLPDPSLAVPQVSAEPSRDEVKRAGDLLLHMVSGFPFVTAHDRANYLGVLLTPLLRRVTKPPYKLVVVTAPQRGSGKSKLANIARRLHGGVFKSEFPNEDAEVRKFITSTLDVTTAPVVQFDNVTGILKSSTLDGLLTSDEWSDRPLGRTDMVTLPNDRLWVVTGNNIHIGGDLERRTLWVTINPNMERPEERTGFAIPDLDGWVRENRGELLWALLTLVRAWVVAGQPTEEMPESTEFGRWIAVLRGILGIAELGAAVGTVGHADSVQHKSDPEDEEWQQFLAAVRQHAGSHTWTARQLLDLLWTELDDALPGDIGERWARNPLSASKALGKWLSFRDGRWAGGLSVVGSGGGSRARLWRVITTDELSDEALLDGRLTDRADDEAELI